MATISFDREIILKDEQAVNIIVDALSKQTTKDSLRPAVDVNAEVKRGKVALTKFCSHLKKS